MDAVRGWADQLAGRVEPRLQAVGRRERPLLVEVDQASLDHAPALDELDDGRSKPCSHSLARVRYPACNQAQHEIVIGDPAAGGRTAREDRARDELRVATRSDADTAGRERQQDARELVLAQLRRPASGRVAPALAPPGALVAPLELGVGRRGANLRDELDVDDGALRLFGAERELLQPVTEYAAECAAIASRAHRETPLE